MAINKAVHTISGKTVSYYFDAPFSSLAQIVAKEKTFLITDENVFAAAKEKFNGWQTIIIKAGEEFKQQHAVDEVIQQLISKEAARDSIIVGVGGGVVTDIAGFVAGIYMRGVQVGFVPTTILAMVDAAIGGKNGVDVGIYKNLVGLIRQPDFLLYDYSFLQTLPHHQWVNGFAEVIKHACIKDAEMFALLESYTLEDFKNNSMLLAALIERNANIKTAVVIKDEFEKGDRRLLNFGHTVGHAIENTYRLLHGYAISIGMMAAAGFSEKLTGFTAADKEKLNKLLIKYGLPVSGDFEYQKILSLLKMDKKRVSNEINFVLLNKIGQAIVKPIPLAQLEQLIQHL